MQAADLKAIRKGLGWTQAQMAAALDVTPQFVSMMETEAKPIERRTALAALYLREHPEAIDSPDQP